MDALHPTRHRHRARPRTIALLFAIGAAFGAIAPTAVAGPNGRMDPGERERLRHDLRDQAREQRYPLPAPGGNRPGYGPPPGYAPRPEYTPAPGFAPPPRGFVPPPPAGPPMPASPAYAPGSPYESPRWHGGPAGRQRMSPEEREQLRMQLRERRRFRD